MILDVYSSFSKYMLDGDGLSRAFLFDEELALCLKSQWFLSQLSYSAELTKTFFWKADALLLERLTVRSC